MKQMKRKVGGMVLFLLEMLVGILLLINPIGFTSSIIIGAGIIMICMSLGSIIRYFRTSPEQAAMEQNLFHGLLLLVAGIFCVTQSSWFLITFPLLTMLYGIGVLISGIAKVQWTVDVIRNKEGKWFLPAISAALSIVCGCVILSSPFSTTAILWNFTGAAIIVEAVFDMIALLFSKSKTAEPDVSSEPIAPAEDGADAQ